MIMFCGFIPDLQGCLVFILLHFLHVLLIVCKVHGMYIFSWVKYLDIYIYLFIFQASDMIKREGYYASYENIRALIILLIWLWYHGPRNVWFKIMFSASSKNKTLPSLPSQLQITAVTNTPTSTITTACFSSNTVLLILTFLVIPMVILTVHFNPRILQCSHFIIPVYR